MKTKAVHKRLLSIFLAVLMAAGSVIPGFAAFAEDGDGGVIGVYNLQIFYDNGEIVPDFDDEENKVAHIEHMKEGEKLQLKYYLQDCVLPDNGYIEWESDTPTVCDVTADGLVRAFDSSKGAAVHLWIDNEVASVPIVGKLLKTIMEKALFGKVNIDTLDTEQIIEIVDKAFGEDSVLAKYIESYKGQLITSLREYLDKVNTTIYCRMYDKDGNPIQGGEDSISVTVHKSDEAWAELIPNGTHITNKQKLPTTVAKGSTLQLNACTTPTRLHMGVIYSVKNSSIFSSGKVVATVDSSGLVTFKNTGTVTIMVSPDTEGFIDNLLKYINLIVGDMPDANGKVDCGKIADVLIKYVGLDINRTVLIGILEACFVIADIAGDTTNPVRLTKTAAKVLANIIYQFTTNDSITFTVVDGVPVTNFEITGTDATEKFEITNENGEKTEISATPVKEGNLHAFGIGNVKPEAADTSDIVWTSSDPATASVDPVTGVVTGRDVGTTELIPGVKTPKLRSDPVLITATSKANNVSKSVYITVKQKTGEYVADAEITAERTNMNIGESQALEMKLYPERIATSRYLTTEWGIVPIGMNIDEYIYDETHYAKEPFAEVDEEGNPVVDENGEPVMNDGTVTDGIGKIDSNGVYTAVAGGTSTIVLRAVTGLETFGIYNKISEVFAFIQIDNGRPVGSISVWTSEDDLKKGTSINTKMIIHPDKEFGGKTYHYATIDYQGAEDGVGATIHATVMPEDVTNKTVKWVVENKDDFNVEDNKDGTVTIRVKAAKHTAMSTNVYCVSQDGSVTSDMITIAVSQSPVKGNRITTDNLEVINGKTATASHEPVIDGNADKRYACYNANWYSDDEDVAVVEDIDENGNAVIRGTDVGTTTLHCVSADGGVDAACTVTVYPDKSNLREIIDLCEKTTLKMTDENQQDYDDFLYQLDAAYYVADDVDMASQTVVDNTAQDLLYLFYKLGGYIGINGVTMLDKDGNNAPDYISVKVSTSTPYSKAKYALGYRLNPENTMYKSIVWESSNKDAVTVDKYGVCRPNPDNNKACYATISVTVTDYFGEQYTDSTVVAFANTPVTGISVSPSAPDVQKVTDVVNLEVDVMPKAGLVTTANITDIIWTSSDESVATVTADSKDSRKAKVTCVYGGECVITATSVDGGYTAECVIVVETNYDPLIEAINTYTNFDLRETSYYPDSYKLFSDAMAQAQAMVDAKASTQKEVMAMIEKLDTAYKGLQKYNYITGIEIYRDGSPTSDYYQYDVAFFSEELLYTKVQFQLNVRLYPNNASYDEVHWRCSNPNIVVDDNGYCKILDKAENRFNAPQLGVITCTVTDHFGHSWSDDVNVSITRTPVTEVQLDKTEIKGELGKTEQLTPILYPRTPDVGSIKGSCIATVQDVMWESDDESIATVDENGLVTFVSAGLTTVRVRTADGGYTAECIVSTKGDRVALEEALKKYKDYDYTDYEYDYGMIFKSAYEQAQKALNDNSLVQSQIDAAARQLENAGSALAGHEFKKAETILLNYVNQTRANAAPTTNWKDDGSQVSVANDAASCTYKKKDTSLVGAAQRTVVNAYLDDSVKAGYTDIKWETVSTSGDVSVDISGAQAIVSTKQKESGYAVLKAAATDVWGRTVERTFRVILASEIVSGITIDQTAVTKPVTAEPFTLTATVNPSSAKIKDVIWYSSDENVATVSNGVVTPVNTGTCVITAETADGGYKATCTVTLETDFSALSAAYIKYNDFVSGVLEEHIYTTKSLAVLQQAIADAAEMLNKKTAQQAQVAEMVARLDDAFNHLELFVGITGAEIILPEGQENVSMPNAGFVRYQSTVMRNGSFKLDAVFSPANATPESIVWSSGNEKDIHVSEDGTVTKATNLGTSTASSVITVTFTDEAGNVATASVYVAFVVAAVEGISFGSTEISGRPGTTQTLRPTFTPALASVRSCVYESSNPEIASVDDNGVVTFNAKGEAVITATSVDGGYSASITAYTTADTSALSAAIDEYSRVDYMDYAYDYGMAFKEAYEAAQAVLADSLAEQAQVDEATAGLQTAYNALAGNEFVGAGEIQLLSGEKVLENGVKLPVDANRQVIITAGYNQDAMLKSAAFGYENANGVEVSLENGTAVITKTTEEPSGTVDILFTVIDDYGRETAVKKSLIIIDALSPISSVQITYNGEEAETASVSKTSRAQLNGATIQLALNTYPLNAEEPAQVLWNITSGDSQITVDQNGLVKMGVATRTSYSATVTCTVILNDGTTVSDSINVSFTSRY